MKVSDGFNRCHMPRVAMRSLWGLLVAAAFLSLTACDNDRDLLVFAATSLRDPLTEISNRYESETGNNVDLSFGGSQSLAQQIVSGAPADVFISAGSAPVAFLDERGFVSIEDSQRLLTNELVVVMLEEVVEMESLEYLASDAIDRLALADPSLAPAGAYAQEALRAAGIWESVQGKLLLGKDVRAAMTYVEVGNADAGVVYRTDAQSSDSLKVAHSVDPGLHSQVIYPAVVVKGSPNRNDATPYLEFLFSEEALAVFRRFGFSDLPAE